MEGPAYRGAEPTSSRGYGLKRNATAEDRRLNLRGRRGAGTARGGRCLPRLFFAQAVGDEVAAQLVVVGNLVVGQLVFERAEASSDGRTTDGVHVRLTGGCIASRVARRLLLVKSMHPCAPGGAPLRRHVEIAQQARVVSTGARPRPGDL